MSAKDDVSMEGDATLSARQLNQLEASDHRAIDTADIPELPSANWTEARRFYRPRKEAVSIRLDADVLDWLRRSSERYQTRINEILRDRMDSETAARR